MQVGEKRKKIQRKDKEKEGKTKKKVIFLILTIKPSQRKGLEAIVNAQEKYIQELEEKNAMLRKSLQNPPKTTEIVQVRLEKQVEHWKKVAEEHLRQVEQLRAELTQKKFEAEVLTLGNARFFFLSSFFVYW